jgi:CheY-like chemotaxis protein
VRAGLRRFAPIAAAVAPLYDPFMASIMIVDDAVDSCEPLGKYLEKSGHIVRCVPNGREALAQVIIMLPDVVILDLFMPEMDGPSFLEVVRSYLRLQSLPVVVLTALSESPMVERARNLQVNAILVKGKATFEDIKKAAEEAVHRIPGT